MDVHRQVKRTFRVIHAVFTLAVLLPAALLSAAGGRAAAPLPHYTVTDLGPLPTRTLDHAPGLNAAGEVAAWREAGDNQFRAVLMQKGQATDLDALPGDTITFASGLNNTGLIVGMAQSPEDLRHTRAVIWQQKRVHDLGTLGGKYAFANAVNDQGQIAGAALTATGARHAVLWQSRKIEDLGTLGTGDASTAWAINTTGESAGESNVVPNGRPHAFLWSRHRMRDLGLLPGGTFGSASALNDTQEAAGSGDLPGGAVHAVLWRGGRPIDLGTLGDEPSLALGLNNHAQAVGTSAIRDSVLRAFLWQDGTMTDLNTLLPPSSGWLLLTAFKINDRGQILCRGFFRGQIHACLLTPTH